jgi:hypothetical protein
VLEPDALAAAADAAGMFLVGVDPGADLPP